MPPLETADRHQTAQYWPRIGVDRNGMVLVADVPTELKVRWVNKRREALNAKNERIAVDVTIVADRDLAIGSILWLGEQDDFGTGTGTSSYPNTDLVQVMAMDHTTSICNKFTRYEALCLRYTNLLPLRR